MILQAPNEVHHFQPKQFMRTIKKVWQFQYPETEQKNTSVDVVKQKRSLHYDELHQLHIKSDECSLDLSFTIQNHNILNTSVTSYNDKWL